MLALMTLHLLCAAPEWTPLADGIEYIHMPLHETSMFGDNRLHIVRSDPQKSRLHVLAASDRNVSNRTAENWRKDFKLTAAINAGMYETDFSTHTGYFRIGKHEQSTQWVKNYQSVLVSSPKEASLPAWDILDLDAPDFQTRVKAYDNVSQNLRLLSGQGKNVWKPSKRRWSEAAIGIDSEGRLYFFFSRSPLSMYQFAEELRQLPFQIERAFHVEGGPEASLSVSGKSVRLKLSGSYETGFWENDGNVKQWELPNVVGVSPLP